LSIITSSPGRSVDRAVDEPGRVDAIVTQGGDKGHGLPAAMGNLGHQPFALRRPTPKRRRRFLSAVMRDPSAASGKPKPLVLDPVVVYQDIAGISVLPLLARLTASHFDVSPTILCYPGAFVVCGLLD
jgi:hypothetical protein